MHPKRKQTGDGPQTAGLEPTAVSIPVARQLLGNKSHSCLYDAIGRGELVAVKDHTKTLITLESIKQYMASLPRAKIKPPTPRRPNHANGGRRDK